MAKATMFLAEEFDRALSQLIRAELAQQLDYFSQTRQAEECRTGKMTEDEAKYMIFVCHDALRTIDRAKVKHMRKQEKKK